MKYLLILLTFIGCMNAMESGTGPGDRSAMSSLAAQDLVRDQGRDDLRPNARIFSRQPSADTYTNAPGTDIDGVIALVDRVRSSEDSQDSRRKSSYVPRASDAVIDMGYIDDVTPERKQPLFVRCLVACWPIRIESDPK